LAQNYSNPDNLSIVMQYNLEDFKMTTMFIKSKVNDYSQWKHIYDGFASLRKQKGVKGASVHRDTNDPNTIIVTQRFKDTNTATTFAKSEELKSAMAKSGVSGQPEIWFGEDIEQTEF
jgi:quinol monooxygenase YgiN